MKTKTINQSVTFTAIANDVYHLIMDQDKHAAFTESEVNMSTEVKGEFSVFDGYCHGYNIELIEGEKIVQAWHFAEEGWPDDHFSTCSFLLKQTGNKTKLDFQQTDVPEVAYDAIKEGWKLYYWEPMKEYLSNM